MTLRVKKKTLKRAAAALALILTAAVIFAAFCQTQSVSFAAENDSKSVATEQKAEEVEQAKETEDQADKSTDESGTTGGSEESSGSKLSSAAEADEEGEIKAAEAFMEMDTTALDKETQTHVATADSEVTIVDTVTYDGASRDDDYHLEARLMDKQTGKAVKVDGKEITAQQAFDPTDYAGTVQIEITFDGREYAGHDVVVFEKIINDSAECEEVAHEDLNDGDQTVTLKETTVAEKILYDVPKTGDKTAILIAAGIAFAAVAGAAVTVLARRKKVE